MRVRFTSDTGATGGGFAATMTCVLTCGYGQYVSGNNCARCPAGRHQSASAHRWLCCRSGCNRVRGVRSQATEEGEAADLDTIRRARIARFHPSGVG
jgi:hypothetical protein